MSAKERTGKRDLTYSGWHRVASIRRYGLSARDAARLGMIDVDACEYCACCGEPLALIETQVSDGKPKQAPVTARLAALAGIPAYSVSIVFGDQEVIAFFRVQRIQPEHPLIQVMLPHEYAGWLLAMRDNHLCPASEESAR